MPCIDSRHTYDWEAWKISWPFLSQNQLFSSNLFHHAKILSFFCGEKLKGKKINSHGMEQAKTSCQLCIHECSQKSIIKVDYIHCCVIIWKLVLLLGGYLSISRSNLFTNSWLLLVHFKHLGLVTYAISNSTVTWYVSKFPSFQISKFPNSTFFTIYLLAILAFCNQSCSDLVWEKMF